ncbi:MAG: sensor histidine kinase [Lawsonibacter sp.]
MLRSAPTPWTNRSSGAPSSSPAPGRKSASSFYRQPGAGLRIVGQRGADAPCLDQSAEQRHQIHSRGGEVSITLQCSPEQIQVQISDTGIGMSPEMISHIFDQYYQGEPNHTEKGLGLGLSIVHRIVELCGGQIQVDSIPDQGSVFTVLLPRSR